MIKFENSENIGVSLHAQQMYADDAMCIIEIILFRGNRYWREKYESSYNSRV